MLRQALIRGIKTLGTRRLYLVTMVAIPLFMTLFFASLLNEGQPVKIPGVVVDLDRSELSREVVRAIKASQTTAVTLEVDNYEDAMEAVHAGKAYGVFIIPRRFQHDVGAGLQPAIEYYSNMTFFVPGTFVYRGYRTVSVVAAAGAVAQKVNGMGVPGSIATPLMQPVKVNINPINNPWANYSLYITPSFLAGCLAVMIFLVTIFSITAEIKNNTSREWLSNAGGSIFVALAGKLIPQFVVFSVVSLGCYGILLGFYGFPIHCSVWVFILATVLLVAACQGFGVLVASILPNPRLALSTGALLGILSISFCGFSYPIQDMYGYMAILGYMMPVRWWFDIFITQALNGYALWFSRVAFLVLALYPLVGLPFMLRLKKAMLNPVYVP